MESQSRRFNLTSALRRLCEDIVTRLDELSHIDLDRVAFNLCQTRQEASHGIYATLTPLRFKSGATHQTVRGRQYRVERLYNDSGDELLYILSFYVPRFLDTLFEEKLATVIHELWHISPKFDGDLRRYEGRYYAHGPSQRNYDAQMNQLAQRWLALDPPEHLYEFLTATFQELSAEYDQITGMHWPAPKLVPL